MGDFRINLIREQVPSLQRRRFAFWLMVGYLGICGIGLVWAANRATQSLMSVAHEREKVRHLEVYFRKMYPGADISGIYLTQLRQQTTRHAETLEAIDAILGKRLALSRILWGLSMPLPRGLYINHLQIDVAGNVFRFDLIVPVGAASNGVDAGRLIALWKQDAELMSELKTVVSVSSKRQTVGSESAFVWSFVCTPSKPEA